MEKVSFDELLQAVHSALVTAQQSLKSRREQAREGRDGAKGSEEGHASVFTFAVPRLGSEGDQYETLTLPVSSFRQQRRPQITMLSLSFDCELDEERFPGAARVFRVILGPEGDRPRRRNRRRKMQVILHGTDSPCGEVLLDGDVLLRFPEQAGAGEGRTVSKARPSLLAKVVQLFRGLWPQHGFALTVEQSMRVRQILAHSAQRQ